jgi:hypothetical protein
MSEKEGTLNSFVVLPEGEELDFRFIWVKLTYPGYDTFWFKFRRQLSRELIDMKDKFYDLPKEEQTEQLHIQRVKTLAKLIENYPNIPGYPVEKSYEEAFLEYFETAFEMINWIWKFYQETIYPKEVTGNTFE